MQLRRRTRLIILCAVACIGVLAYHWPQGRSPDRLRAAVSRLDPSDGGYALFEDAKSIVGRFDRDLIWDTYRNSPMEPKSEQFLVMAAYYLGDNRFEGHVRTLAGRGVSLARGLVSQLATQRGEQ